MHARAPTMHTCMHACRLGGSHLVRACQHVESEDAAVSVLGVERHGAFYPIVFVKDVEVQSGVHTLAGAPRAEGSAAADHRLQQTVGHEVAAVPAPRLHACMHHSRQQCGCPSMGLSVCMHACMHAYDDVIMPLKPTVSKATAMCA